MAPHVVSCTPVGAWLRGAWLEELGAVPLCLPVRCEGLRPHSLLIIPLSSTFPERRSLPVDSLPNGIGIESGQVSLQEELGVATRVEGSWSSAPVRRKQSCHSYSVSVFAGVGRRAPTEVVGECESAPALRPALRAVLGHGDPAWSRFTETWKSPGRCRDANRTQPQPRVCASKGSEKINVSPSEICRVALRASNSCENRAG